jgi:AraC-like DNA-binding protein
MIVPVAGRMTVRIAGQEFCGEPGMVLIYPRGIGHEECSDAEHPAETRFISFDWDRASEGLPLRVEDVDGRIRQAIDWLYADRDLADSPAVKELRETMLRLILSRYQICARHNRQEDELVRRVRTYAREHLASPITLEELAETVSLSRFHFIRVYRRLSGRSPMAEVRAIRLEHARELLLSTGLLLKQIAPRCGMGSEYALSRAFARQFGYPPSEVRQRRAGADSRLTIPADEPTIAFKERNRT